MNNLKSLFTIFICWTTIFVSAQQLHTPQEITQYMESSSIQYEIDSLPVVLDSVVLPLVEKGYFLVETENGSQLQKRNFSLTKKAKKYYKKA